MTILPAVLDVPRDVAKTVLLEGDHVTARDLSYVLATLYLAARSEPTEPGHWRIPDNRLRGALGRTSRDTVDVEDARFRRLRDAVLHIDSTAYPAPTSMFRGDTPVRANLDDELSWLIDPDLVDRFRPTAGMVGVPRALLANARGMSSLLLGLRVLAFADGRRTFRATIALDDLRKMLGVDGVAPSILIGRYLAPAASDLMKSCGISVDFVARKASTMASPSGRIRDVVLQVGIPDFDPEQPDLLSERALPRAARPLGHGGRRGRPAKRPATVDVSNVVALRTPLKSLFKMRTIGSTDVQGIDDKDDLSF
jgi:hypothetical protein